MAGTHSGRALAAALDVTEGAVRTAVKSGRIKRENDGRFDLEKCRTEWLRTTDPVRVKVRKSATRPATQCAVPRAQCAPARPAPSFSPEAYVWLHIRPAPAYAALVAMSWGAPLRTAYLVYRSTAMFLGGQYERAFDARPPDGFEPIGFDFLQEEFKATLGPDDLATWDHEFAHQWDEPA